MRKVPVVGGIARIDGLLGTAGESDIEIEAPNYWMPPQRLDLSSSSLRLPVWRTAIVRGRFVPRLPSKNVPSSFKFEMQSSPGVAGPVLARGTVIEGSVNADGSWACRAPVTTLDVIIRAKTFTPRYVWDLKVKSDAATDLGEIALEQGASVVAWLDRATAQSLKTPAKAQLVRLTMAPSPTLGERLSLPVAQAVFNRRGAVQLTSVPPGTYTLEVTAAAFATARLDNIVVYDRSESMLRAPIKLEPPLPIRISLNPARDAAGAAWRVSLDRSDRLTFRRTAVAAGSASSGFFQVDGQSPGHYTATVADHEGNLYAQRQFDLKSEVDSEQRIDIDMHQVRGKLTAAHEPIAAHLIFGGRNGAERVTAISADDGAFSVILPHAGTWIVDVESKQNDIIAAVTASIAADANNVDIDLPDTVIAGWVVGLDGKRVANAAVTLYSSAGAITRETGADGTFRFRGVPAGSVKVTASDRHTSEHSRFVEFPVADETRKEDLELALQNMAAVKGTVISQGQPVVGARITGYGLGAGIARQARGVSGLDGGFELEFADSATQIGLIVAAPGRTLQAFSTPPTDKKITIDVAAVGGVLRLQMPPGASRPGVSYAGTPIPMPDLLLWARAEDPSSAAGGVLSIPNVAPGNYQFCFARGGSDVCRDGTLAPGGELVLGMN